MARRSRPALGLLALLVLGAAAPAVLAEGFPVCAGCPLWVAAPVGAPHPAFVRALVAGPGGDRLFVTGDAPTGTTVALDALSGAPLWWASHPAGRAIAVAPDGGRVFVAGAASVALEAATGLVAWTASFEGEHLAVAPDGSFVVAAGGPRLEVRDALGGALRWGADMPFAPRDVVVASQGRLVVAGGDGGLVALRAEDGSAAWTSWGTPLHLALADGGDTVVFAQEDGGFDATVAAVAADTGASRWYAWVPFARVRDLAVSPDGASIVVAGRFCGFAATVLATADGAERWSLRPSGSGSAEVAVVTGDSAEVLLLGTREVAHDLATGEPRWEPGLPPLPPAPEPWPALPPVPGGALLGQVVRAGEPLGLPPPPPSFGAPGPPVGAAASPDGSRVYVAGPGADFGVAAFFTGRPAVGGGN